MKSSIMKTTYKIIKKAVNYVVVKPFKWYIDTTAKNYAELFRGRTDIPYWL